ncbi:resolvase, N-terminal domain protein [Aeromicrobium marinum DSM 15272]|uniref:Resolvase, N-terminal domain protein n=1 Tax=Aeromicrobium marinum DSM 15272 TaxID=585531 RepID=E2SE19_9ACTN|nr:recombinase family protein [Aeromicrobium marinum]EFQ82746.1 resolvase, N-terminal domain protein [Aeromicrobium marinum DSM 15272]
MASSLRPVPETPPRAVLYLRQSVSRDDSISLALQEAACRQHAVQNGYQVVAVESDPGVSGRTWQRPAVQRTIAMVEDGQADVIVLWRWSRLSRSRRDWAIAADKVDVAGGRIESATEAVDVTTATGRLARGVLTEFAAFESDRIGEVWKEVHASRVQRGLVPNGNRRFGYTLNRETRIHEPHPLEAPAVVTAYERAAAGESPRTIAEALNNRGFRTVKEGPWSDTTLTRFLDQGFAAGRIVWKGDVYPGAHEPLITTELWQAYTDRRAQRLTVPPRTKRSPYLLSGMVKCGRCGGPMTGSTVTFGPQFRCRRRAAYGREHGCTGGAVQMWVVEEKVREWVTAFAAQVDDATERAASTLAAQVTAEGEETRLAAAVVRVEGSLRRLTVQLADGLVPAEAYTEARDELMGRRQVLVDQLEEASRAVRAAGVDQVAIAQRLVDQWDRLPFDVLRTTLRDLVDRVEVETARASGVGGRGGVSRAKVTVFEKA